MPRVGLPAGVQAAVSTDAYRSCLAVEVGTSPVLRITDNPAGVTITNAFTAGYLVVSETTIGDQPAVSVKIANTGNDVSALDLDSTAGGGVIGKTLKIWEVTYDSTGAQLTADVLYSGIVSSMVADAESAELVGTLAELCSAGMVGIITSRLCPYRYGGARCGDTDGTSCDHTFAGCTAHSNTARFGGFRTMPTLNTKLQYFLSEYVPGANTFGHSAPPTDPTPPHPPGTVRRHLGRGTSTTKPMVATTMPLTVKRGK
jgi:hypothetical protein